MDTSDIFRSDLHILVVDDVLSARSVISRLLKKMGFQNIIEAENGTMALEQLKSGLIELVIADLHLPDMKATDILLGVRNSEELRDIPFIMISSDMDREHIVQAKKAGVSGCLLKPINFEILKEEIREALSKSS